MSEKVKIACPHCHVKLAISNQLIGQSRKCPKCGVPFKINIPHQATEPFSNPVPPSQVDSPLDPIAPIPNASFQAKLAQHRGTTPQRPLTRKEKLERARNKQAQADNNFDWQTAGWGVALVIVAFVSVAMPDAESVRGGRGVIKLLGKALFILGPYAPLLGMFLGLGGVGLIAISAKNLPKAAVIAVGSVLSLFIVLACGASFLYHTGMFDSSGSGGTRQSAVLSQAQIEKNKEEFDKVVDNLNSRLAARNESGFGTGSAPPPTPAARTPFQDNSSQETDPSASEAGDNPFGSPEEDFDSSSDSPSNPFEDRTDEKPAKKSPDRDPNPFGAVDDSNFASGSAVKNQMANHQLRFDVAKRFNQGESLIRFQQKGFSNDAMRLKLGQTAGSQSRMGKAFYGDDPIEGIAFFQDTVSYLLPSWSETDNTMTSRVKSGEAVYGVNLNFSNGKLAGVQVIFATNKDGQMDVEKLSTGDWLGQAPSGNQFESINGGGKKIYGFVVGQKAFDIIGFQLIVEK